MINLKRTILIALCYPDGAFRFRAQAYFLRKGLDLGNIHVVSTPCSVVESRNRSMKDLVLPLVQKQKPEWVIFIDRDNCPNHLTDPFFDDVDSDVVGCGYPMTNEAAWITSDIFHMGLCRVRADLLPKLKPPWFMFEYNEDGTQITKCECGYFRNKLLETGAAITRRGHCEHLDSKHDWVHTA